MLCENALGIGPAGAPERNAAIFRGRQEAAFGQGGDGVHGSIVEAQDGERCPAVDRPQNGGLIEAARHFDPAADRKFITHGMWWVRQAIMHSLAEAQTAALRAQLEHHTTTSEAVDELETSSDDLLALLKSFAPFDAATLLELEPKFLDANPLAADIGFLLRAALSATQPEPNQTLEITSTTRMRVPPTTLELLDPYRFTRGVKVRGKRDLEDVMVRRLKEDIREVQGGFPRRDVVRIEIDRLPADAPERTRLREQWAVRIRDAHLLEAMTPQEMVAETMSVYDNYVGVLETGIVEALQHYARDLSERIIPRGVETHEVVGIVLLLRDVLARSLFEKYQRDFGLLNRILDVYEPAANRIANTVAVSFVEERERVIRQQQDSLLELSTPVLQVRERLLILPIIGVLDDMRARQLTEQLLRGIRTNRARVVVIDITGVPAIDSTVANHLVQTVDASRLMGASVIITGLSSEIAQTLVTLGVDLSKVNAVGDLQGGIEEAERLLGYTVISGAVAEKPEERG